MENEIHFDRFDDLEIVQGYSSHSFPHHSHRHYCLGLILDGMIEFSCEKQHYRLAKGQFYLVPPFTEHTIAAIDNQSYRYLVFCFSGSWYRGETSIGSQSYVGPDGVDGERLLMSYNRFKANGDLGLLRQEIGGVLQQFAVGADVILPEFNSVVAQSIRYIEEHLEEPLDLQKIAAAVHVTRFRLSRQFKNQLGVAPYQYYIQAKIKKVRQGLLTRRPLSDLAYHWSFTDQSHLCHTFKKYTGVSPLRFKECFRDQTSK